MAAVIGGEDEGAVGGDVLAALDFETVEDFQAGVDEGPVPEVEEPGGQAGFSVDAAEALGEGEAQVARRVVVSRGPWVRHVRGK